MEKKCALFLLVLLFSTCISCKTKSVPRNEYLIDIVIKNEEQIPIQYLVLSLVLEEGECELTKATQGDKGFIHFAVSYDPNAIFVLAGKTVDADVEKYYFDLKDTPNVEQSQELDFYLQKTDEKIVITADAVD